MKKLACCACFALFSIHLLIAQSLLPTWENFYDEYGAAAQSFTGFVRVNNGSFYLLGKPSDTAANSNQPNLELVDENGATQWVINPFTWIYAGRLPSCCAEPVCISAGGHSSNCQVLATLGDTGFISTEMDDSAVLVGGGGVSSFLGERISRQAYYCFFSDSEVFALSLTIVDSPFSIGTAIIKSGTLPNIHLGYQIDTTNIITALTYGVVDLTGNLVMVGQVQDSGQPITPVAVKMTEGLDKIWVKQISPRSQPHIGDPIICMTGANDSIFITGRTINPAGNFNQLFVAKLDLSGNLIWLKYCFGNVIGGSLNYEPLPSAFAFDYNGKLWIDLSTSKSSGGARMLFQFDPLTGDSLNTIVLPQLDTVTTVFRKSSKASTLYIDSNNHMLIAGRFRSDGKNVVLNIDSAGNVFWVAKLNPASTRSPCLPSNVMIMGDGSETFYAGSNEYNNDMLCAMYLARYDYKDSVTGINDLPLLTDFKLYPNPANSSVTLTFSDKAPQKVEIFNSLREPVKYCGIVSNYNGKFSFALDKIDAGVYFVRATFDETILSRPLVIIK